MKFLRKLAFIDESVYQKSDNRCKTQINVLALFLPASSLLAGGAFYFAIDFLLESTLMGVIVGSMISFLMFSFDRTILEEFSINKIIGRLMSSFFIASIMALPFKASISKDTLSKAIYHETEEKNAWIMTEMEEEIQLIYDKEEELLRRVEAAAALYDKTGKSQKLVEARRTRDSFLEKKDDLLAAIDTKYETRFIEPNVSNVAITGRYFYTMLDTNKPEQFFTNIFIFLILIFIEAAPSVLRLSLESGSYINKKRHLDRIAKKADIEIQDLQEEMIDELGSGNEIELLTKFEIYNAFRGEIINGFQNTDAIISLSEKAKKLNEPQPPQLKSAQKKMPPNNRQPKKEFPEFQYIKKQS